MKKILFLMLFFISLPAFSVPGYQEAMDAIGGKPIVYDDSEAQAYYEKLYKAYNEKYSDGYGRTGENFNSEVMIPLLDFEAQLQKQCKQGFNYDALNPDALKIYCNDFSNP